MNDVALTESNINTMTAFDVAKVTGLEKAILEHPQVDIFTDHVIHAGMYARTIFVPAGVVLTGVLMKLATILIISGRFILYAGDKAVELNGYHVMTGYPNRKQAGVAITDTWVTMIFPTDAKSVKEGEEQFTDEAYNLSSRKDGALNNIKITGV